MSINPATRPGSVTIVVVLTWINAVLHLLFGILLLVAGVAVGSTGVSSGRAVATGVLVGVGIIYLLIGLVTAFVAARLGRGGRGSRMLLTIIEVITIVANLIAWIAANSNQQAVSSVIAIIVAGVILALLWNRNASDFFNAS